MSTWSTADEIAWLHGLRDDRHHTRYEKYCTQLRLLPYRHLDGKWMDVNRDQLRAELLRLIAETSPGNLLTRAG